MRIITISVTRRSSFVLKCKYNVGLVGEMKVSRRPSPFRPNNGHYRYHGNILTQEEFICCRIDLRRT